MSSESFFTHPWKGCWITQSLISNASCTKSTERAATPSHFELTRLRTEFCCCCYSDISSPMRTAYLFLNFSNIICTLPVGCLWHSLKSWFSNRLAFLMASFLVSKGAFWLIAQPDFFQPSFDIPDYFAKTTKYSHLFEAYKNKSFAHQKIGIILGNRSRKKNKLLDAFDSALQHFLPAPIPLTLFGANVKIVQQLASDYLSTNSLNRIFLPIKE